MRCLERNKRGFYYLNYLGKTAVKDANQNETGEYTDTYSSAKYVMGNISAAKGNVNDEPFGTDLQYDRVIVLDDCDITENSVLFVDSAPSYDANDNPNFDYIVRRIARSLNSVSIAISKVR